MVQERFWNHISDTSRCNYLIYRVCWPQKRRYHWNCQSYFIINTAWNLRSVVTTNSFKMNFLFVFYFYFFLISIFTSWKMVKSASHCQYAAYQLAVICIHVFLFARLMRPTTLIRMSSHSFHAFNVDDNSFRYCRFFISIFIHAGENYHSKPIALNLSFIHN